MSHENPHPWRVAQSTGVGSWEPCCRIPPQKRASAFVNEVVRKLKIEEACAGAPAPPGPRAFSALDSKAVVDQTSIRFFHSFPCQRGAVSHPHLVGAHQ